MVAQINTAVTQYTLMHNNSGSGHNIDDGQTASIRNKNACRSNKYKNSTVSNQATPVLAVSLFFQNPVAVSFCFYKCECANSKCDRNEREGEREPRSCSKCE